MFAENIENLDYNNIIICDPIKNSIIEQSNFYKIIYSNRYVSYNGLYVLFNIDNIQINKDKINFTNNNNNNNILNELIKLEEYIIKQCINSKVKNINYKLREYLANNSFKFVYNDDINKFNSLNKKFINNLISNNIDNNIDNNSFFILKISGLWETRENIGMTFKIIKINKYLSIC